MIRKFIEDLIEEIESRVSEPGEYTVGYIDALKYMLDTIDEEGWDDVE